MCRTKEGGYGLTIVGEVSLSELVLLDLQGALEQLLGLLAADGDVNGNLFVSPNAEGADRVAGLGLDGSLVGQVREHLGGLGELIAGLARAEVKDELVDGDVPHLVVELFLLLLLVHIFFLNQLNLLIIKALTMCLLPKPIDHDPTRHSSPSNI